MTWYEVPGQEICQAGHQSQRLSTKIRQLTLVGVVEAFRLDRKPGEVKDSIGNKFVNSWLTKEQIT